MNHPVIPVHDCSIYCPYCTNKIFKHCNNPYDIITEKTIINCKRCHQNFIYVNCPKCQEKIYFMTNIKYYLDSIMIIKIQCPYIDCNFIFSYNNCNFCGRSIINSLDYINRKESKLICGNNNCMKNYNTYICPYISCKNSILILFDDIKEGIELKCEEENIFQQVSCIKCKQYLIWKNEDKINYIEGQRIYCPNKECGVSCFNKIYCSLCNGLNIFKSGGFDFGVLIQCIYCPNKFSKYFCPKCYVIIESKENVEGKFISCKCLNSFSFINCLYCHGINFFNKINYYIPGQIIICVYCNKSFNKILCPYCNGVNGFYKSEFKYGEEYQCIYDDCKQSFIIYLCPLCKTTNYSQEIKNIITCNNCENKFSNTICLYCSCIIGYLGQLDQQDIQCPNDKCKNIFKCIRSSGLSPVLEDQYGSNNILNIIYLKIYPHTKRLIGKLFNSNKNNNDTNKIKHGHETKILMTPYLKTFNFSNGISFNFNNPEIHYLDTYISNLIIHNQKIYCNLRKYKNINLPTLEEILSINNNI